MDRDGVSGSDEVHEREADARTDSLAWSAIVKLRQIRCLLSGSVGGGLRAVSEGIRVRTWSTTQSAARTALVSGCDGRFLNRVGESVESVRGAT